MNRDDTRFQDDLTESLGRLARAAPAGPDAARVLGALRRRKVRRGVTASLAACALVAVGLWIAWVASPERPQPGRTTPGLAQVPGPAPQTPPLAGASITPTMPPLTFHAPAMAAVLPAPRTEMPSLSLPVSLKGPAPAGSLDSRLPALSFALGRMKNQPTP